MLKFTDAIEEVEAVTKVGEDFANYLKQHAPDIAATVLADMDKNLTVGDVHVSSAGGDGGKKKKTPKDIKGVSVLTGNLGQDDSDDTAAKKNSSGFDPATATFDSDGSSDRAFDWFIQQILAGTPVEKLKLKVKLECDPTELQALAAALGKDPQDVASIGPAAVSQLARLISVGKDAGTRTIRIVRHGATHLNNQDTSVDRIRGWKDVPLSEEGRKEAEKLAEKMAKDPPDHLVCSDLKRAHDTAKCIAKACDIPIDEVSSGFRPWNVGKYAGQSSKTAVPILCDYAINKPDEKVPEGESFNEFRSRFFKALDDVVGKYDRTIAVVTHHRGERLLSSWQAAGFPTDGTIDGKEFTKKGEGTAGEENMEIPVAKLKAAAEATVTKWTNADIDLAKIFEGNEQVDKTFTVNVAKVDAEQRIFYGWAYVSEENGKVIVDKQDDYILPADLVKAAEDFTLQGGKLGDMHDARNVGRVVASFVTSADLCKAFGLSVANDRRGWILGFKVDDPAVWSKIKSGAQLELSIGGKGERIPTP